MSNAESFEALAGVVLFGGVVILLYGPIQNLVIEYARQKVFQIRDEIFLDVATNKVPLQFNSESYRAAREALNRLIRFMHLVTWPRLLLAIRLYKGQANESMMSIMTIEDQELKEYLVRKLFLAHLVAFVLMWVRSPLLMLLSIVIVPIACVVFLSTIGNGLIRAYFSRFENALDKEASIGA